ncbi:MAG TPA: hypothetical protein VMT70_17595 [Vicinamibacteria bacterium]|nr:hypothetical protein [Vicinamibacteria bacterium]
MIQHVWTVFCSSSAIDRDTNQVSLFDLVERIGVEGVGPAPPGQKAIIPARFQLVTLWTRGDANEGETGATRMRLLAPNGEELLKSEGDVNLREHQSRRVRINIGGLPFVENGRYHFRVELRDGDGWRVVGDVPVQIDVRLQVEREPAEEAAAG